MKKKPQVLITNDDGLDARGIQAVIESLKNRFDLMIVAPKQERSGASHSITLKRDIHLEERQTRCFAFDGTPVDCVSFALRNLVEEKPELCISGINHGANLGNDTLCSGTVGAALAAALEGIPSIAISLLGHDGVLHFDTAVHVLNGVLAMRNDIFSGLHNRVLNINVPNIPAHELQGVKVCRLGDRVWSDEFVPGKTPQSFRYFLQAPINFGGKDFDVTEVDHGFATISVLKPSLYDEDGTDALKGLQIGLQQS